MDFFNLHDFGDFHGQHEHGGNGGKDMTVPSAYSFDGRVCGDDQRMNFANLT